MAADSQHMPEWVPEAFDAESFRSTGHRLIDCLSDYLGDVTKGVPMPVLAWTEPEAMLQRWSGAFPVEPEGDLLDTLQPTIREANHLHHPHYVGHQVAPPLPSAALCDLVASFLNNGMAVYEHGAPGTAMELRLVKWMAQNLGLGEKADGVFTSGGSVGNLTALLAAREVAAKRGALEAQDRPAVLVSEAAHYSLARAVKIMGWGEGGIVPVASDGQLRLRPDSLEEALAKAEEDGRRVIAVVGNACCTPTGAYDPLEAIGDFCAKHELWLHVDGAHGASAALSEKYRHLLAGVERADSVVWDAHKMMLMPAACTAVIFREGSNAYAAFAQKASYLYDHDAHEEWYNLGHRTIECTKHMMALKLYAALLCHGTRLFSEYVTRTYDLARVFAEMIHAAPDFEVGAEPESNILCFRYLPEGANDLDGVQVRVRRRLLEKGEFYIVQARLPKGLFLRTALMNPFTEEKHLAALLDVIRAAHKGTT